jgi:hypothetical protein
MSFNKIILHILLITCKEASYNTKVSKMTTYTIYKFLSVLSNSVITRILLPEWFTTKGINLFSLKELFAYMGASRGGRWQQTPSPINFLKKIRIKKRKYTEY